MQFSTNNLCSTSTDVLLTVSFTSFFICFTFISTFLSSGKGMLWLAKISTRKVRSETDDGEIKLCGAFTFHRFVLFDIEDTKTAGWIDSQLLPRLTETPPYMKITISGRDDQCGFSYVTQLLRKIEASRKVIIVLTGCYWQSNQGKYVLSAIEDVRYQTGQDRSVIVTFENDFHIGGLLKRHRSKNPLSVSQFPEDERYSSIFWESLRNLLL